MFLVCRTSSCCGVPFWLMLAFMLCCFICFYPPSHLILWGFCCFYIYGSHIDRLVFLLCAVFATRFHCDGFHHSGIHTFNLGTFEGIRISMFATSFRFQPQLICISEDAVWVTTPIHFTVIAVFFYASSDGGICDHQMLCSNVWTTCPKTLLGSKIKAVEKGRRPFRMLQICSFVFACDRIRSLFVYIYYFYIRCK